MNCSASLNKVWMRCSQRKYYVSNIFRQSIINPINRYIQKFNEKIDRRVAIEICSELGNAHFSQKYFLTLNPRLLWNSQA